MWRFYVGDNTAGRPSWWLYAANNEMVSWAGETFDSLHNAQRAAAAFQVGARTARYDIYQDAGDAWRWRASRGSDKVASSGESFSSRLAAEQAAARVRDNSGNAGGIAA